MTKGKELLVNEVPAFLQSSLNSNRGNANVEQEDLIMARLDQCQAMSKAREEGAPEYIEGIKEGDFYNSVTRENYGDRVNVIFVDMKIKYIVWFKRDEASLSEFRGSFDSFVDAQNKVQSTVYEDKAQPEQYQIARTPTHYALVAGESLEWVPVAMPMSNSKGKLSKTINSLVSQFGGDRFSRQYVIEKVSEVSKKNGKRYFNAKVTPNGFVKDEPVFRLAEKMFEMSSKTSVFDDQLDVQSETVASEEEAPF